MSSAERRSARPGFTLVELLVAMFISIALVAVVLQLLNGQTRFVASQSQREEAQQNVRGALEVLSSEVRSAIPGAVTLAEAQTLEFMQPRIWGMLCGPAADGNANSVDAVFPQVSGLNTWSLTSAAGVLINGSAPGAAPNWLPNPHVNAAVAVLAQATEVAWNASSCDDAPAGTTLTAPAGSQVVMRLRSANAALGTLAAGVGGGAGNAVVVSTPTRYDIADVDGRTWLRRSNGTYANGSLQMQPLAGPLVSNRFGFTYFSGSPAVEVAAPGTTEAQLEALRMIRIQVVTQSLNRVGTGAYQRDSGAVTVMLRNPR